MTSTKPSKLVYSVAGEIRQHRHKDVAILHDLLVDEGQEYLAECLMSCIKHSGCHGVSCHVVVRLAEGYGYEELVEYCKEFHPVRISL